MSVTSMNHFTVLSDDLEATREFYVDFLGGLKVGWRPPFQFPGWWLYAGDTPILHVIHRDHLPEGDRAGVLDHMAFSAEDLPGTVKKLKSRNGFTEKFTVRDTGTIVNKKRVRGTFTGSARVYQNSTGKYMGSCASGPITFKLRHVS